MLTSRFDAQTNIVVSVGVQELILYCGFREIFIINTLIYLLESP